MPWIDDVGYVEDEIPKPASYEEQVAYARQIGVPENEIAGNVGTPESVAANAQTHAQTIHEATGQAPSWSQDVGYVPPPPAWLNPQHYVSEGFDAPYTQEQITGAVDPSNYRTMNGQLYASAKGPSDLSGGEYLIDPNTGRFALDSSGNPIGVTYPAPSGFHDFITTPEGALTTGAAIMAALYGGTALLDAYGAGAGGFGLTGSSGSGGAMGANSALQLAPSAGTIGGYGSITAPSLAGGLGVGSGGVLGAAALSPEAVAIMEAMNAGAGYGLNASQVPNLAQGLGLADAATGGLTLADLLSGAKTGASLLGTGSSLLGTGSKIAGLANQLTGGTSAQKSTLNPYGTGYNAGDINTTNLPNITADLTRGNTGFTLGNAPAATPAQIYSTSNNPAIKQGFAEGGEVEDHNPSFFSEGGLGSMENRYVKGEGDGTSDSVAAMLANGEFVIPADVVSKLGNGSNDAGANVLDEFMAVIREHAQKHDPKELPPDSKGPLQYLAEANKKAQA
jgi:hypothetical protein